MMAAPGRSRTISANIARTRTGIVVMLSAIAIYTIPPQGDYRRVGWAVVRAVLILFDIADDTATCPTCPPRLVELAQEP